MNYFALLSLPSSFNLDLTQLESAYFAAQREYHPDRFIGKPDAERLKAVQQSADINQAYQTLKHPLSRAKYLLKLQDIEADKVTPSQKLLMEAMEMRESPDKALLEKQQAESIAGIARHFDAKNWDAMAQETLRLGYIEKAIQ